MKLGQEGLFLTATFCERACLGLNTRWTSREKADCKQSTTPFHTSTREIPTLLYTSSLKKEPLSSGTSPYIVYYRECPPGGIDNKSMCWHHLDIHESERVDITDEIFFKNCLQAPGRTQPSVFYGDGEWQMAWCSNGHSVFVVCGFGGCSLCCYISRRRSVIFERIRETNDPSGTNLALSFPRYYLTTDQLVYRRAAQTTETKYSGTPLYGHPLIKHGHPDIKDSFLCPDEKLTYFV